MQDDNGREGGAATLSQKGSIPSHFIRPLALIEPLQGDWRLWLIIINIIIMLGIVNWNKVTIIIM